MGEYTEFHFNCELIPDVPMDVVRVLRYMLDRGEVPDPLPPHPLFQTTRWRIMLLGNSVYFPADTISTLRLDSDGKYYLCIRCNFKNYDMEIQRFVDWIRPYVNAPEGYFLGFRRMAGTPLPYLITK